MGKDVSIALTFPGRCPHMAHRGFLWSRLNGDEDAPTSGRRAYESDTKGKPDELFHITRARGMAERLMPCENPDQRRSMMDTIKQHERSIKPLTEKTLFWHWFPEILAVCRMFDAALDHVLLDVALGRWTMSHEPVDDQEAPWARRIKQGTKEILLEHQRKHKRSSNALFMLVRAHLDDQMRMTTRVCTPMDGLEILQHLQAYGGASTMARFRRERRDFNYIRINSIYPTTPLQLVDCIEERRCHFADSFL